MKSYKDITNKYLKQNLKRSVLTVCGVILSVALITSIGLFIKGLQNMLIDQEIQKKGAYFVKLEGSTDIYKKIINNPKIDKVGLVDNFDTVSLKSDKSIQMIKMDKNGFKLIPCSTIEGRLPSGENEIALEKWVLTYMDSVPKLGDKIKLKLSNGGIKEYTLTGFIEGRGQVFGKSSGIIYSDNININNSTIYLTILKKAGISQTIRELNNKFKNVETNSYLLDYMGEGDDNSLNMRLYLIAAIVIAVAVLATLAVIYNSFQISVVERVKQFGLLKAVGTTPKQIKKIVFREASIISIIGVPLGLLSGIFAIWAVTKAFKVMTYSMFKDIRLSVPCYLILISAAIGVITVYSSALIPARFASRISPLVAISSRTSIVKEKVSKKRGRLLKRFLGINSLMAFKNIKRNQKRFRATVFSISISIALFVFFSSFINMSQNFTTSDSESSKTHFMVFGTSNLSKSGIIDKIKNNPLVKNIYVSYGNPESKALISNDQKDTDAQRVAPEIFENASFEARSMTSVGIIYDIYDKEKLENSTSYITDGKIDYNKMVLENGIIVVRNNTISKGSGKRYKGPITKLKLNDSFYVSKNILPEGTDKAASNKENGISFNNNNTVRVKVSAIADNPPYDFYTDPDYLRIIVPKDVYKNIYMNDLSCTSADIILKDENTQEEFGKWLQPLSDSSGISMIDVIANNKQNAANSLQFKILMYGFIIVISLIGAVNIINTITTNLILRRKEIASLSALGMTYKNIRKMIITEGILYGLYGCIYGLAGGLFLSYINSRPMRDIMQFKLNIPVGKMAAASTAAILISLIAVIRPLNRIKKENIVDVIRSEE